MEDLYTKNYRTLISKINDGLMKMPHNQGLEDSILLRCPFSSNLSMHSMLFHVNFNSHFFFLETDTLILKFI